MTDDHDNRSIRPRNEQLAALMQAQFLRLIDEVALFEKIQDRLRDEFPEDYQAMRSYLERVVDESADRVPGMTGYGVVLKMFLFGLADLEDGL